MDNMLRTFKRRALERAKKQDQEKKGLELGNKISTEMARSVPELEDKVVTDPLTGLLNRRGFAPYVEDAIARLDRKKGDRTVAIMFFDVDNFKTINDTQGHRVGDGVLVEIARVLKEHVRGEDKVARLGGEEFCVLFEDDGVENALKRAEALRETISLLKIKTGNGPLSVSASIGVAARSPGDDFDADTLIGRADKAMYQAKERGRNRVVLWSEPPDESQPGHQYKLDLGE
ncbi:MAG: GGDEF domain-containing protein [bacterium]|nr:GGDEF domain-containing protein [bacterium]